MHKKKQYIRFIHLTLLLIAVPPIGTYFICTEQGIPRWAKIASVCYCALTLYLLLTIGSHTEAVSVDARLFVSPSQT